MCRNPADSQAKSGSARLVTLWDLMTTFPANELAFTVSSLHGVACRCAKEELGRGKGAEADPGLLDKANHALKLSRQFATAGKLRRSGRVAFTAERHLADAGIDITTIKTLLIGVVNEIHRDLGELAFLRVSEDRTKFIDH